MLDNKQKSGIKICSYCNQEITGKYEHIKTNRNTELDICEKCMPKSKGKE